jgi:hypothetical protein
MNYAELTAALQDTVENSFTADQLALFFGQAEEKIYNSVQIPALRKNVLGNVTQGVNYLSVPTDFLYVYSLAVVVDGVYQYLLDKDVNFIREAYPDPAQQSAPKHYALFDEDSFIVGPTPDQSYAMELHYGYYPESIVTAGNTWLSENFDTVLLNGALVEAIRFLKGEPDMVKLYTEMYIQSLTLLKNLGDGKLRQDSYRNVQNRVKPI